jgi:hypothetical protein
MNWLPFLIYLNIGISYAYLNYINVKVVINLSFWDNFMFGGHNEDPNNNVDRDQDKDHGKEHNKDIDSKPRRRKTQKKQKT